LSWRHYKLNDGTFTFATHYLLSVSYDDAIKRITEKLGSGEERDPIFFQTNSDITNNYRSGTVVEVAKYVGIDGYWVNLTQLPLGGKGYSWRVNSDSGAYAPSLNGTWDQNWVEDGKQNSLKYTFSGSNYTCNYSWRGGNGSYSGTFSRTDRAITFTRQGSAWTQNYVLSGNVLFLEPENPENHFNGYFVKQ